MAFGNVSSTKHVWGIESESACRFWASLYFGIENSATRDRNLQLLLIALGHLIVWPYTNDAAEEYGRLRAELRRIGRPMQQIDIQVAAIALTLGNCTVVTTDTDLAAVPGLLTENWAAAIA